MGIPKVSVIIPVYNAQNYLSECIDSVLRQTMQDFEVICIDDGSSDDSYSILKKYAETEERVVLFSQTNQGVSTARNVGIDKARSEYIYFLDSDDYIEPNMLEIAYKEMESKSLDILYFETFAFGEEGIPQNIVDDKNKYYAVKFDYNAVYGGKELLCKMRVNYDYSCSVWKQMIRKSFLFESQVRFYQGIIHEDELYTLQTMLLARRVEFIHRVLHHRRLRANSIMTRSIGFDSVFGYFVCLKEAYRFLLQNECTENELSSLLSLLRSFSVNARNQYGRLSEQEQKKRNMLSENDKFLFNLAIADSLDLIKQRDKVTGEKQNLVRDRDAIAKKLIEKENSFVMIEQAKADVARKLAETEQKTVKAEQEKADVVKKLAETEQKAVKAEQAKADVARKLAEAEQKAEKVEQEKADIAKKLTETEQKAVKAEQEKADIAKKLTETEQKAVKAEQAKADVARKLAEVEQKAEKVEQEKADIAKKLTETEQKFAKAEQAKAEVARKLTETEQKFAKAEQAKAEVARKLTETEQKFAKAEQAKAEVARKLTETETTLKKELEITYKQHAEISGKLIKCEQALSQERKIYLMKLLELQKKK